MADNVLCAGWPSFPAQFYFIFFPASWTPPPLNLLGRKFCNSPFPLSYSTRGNLLCVPALSITHDQAKRSSVSTQRRLKTLKKQRSFCFQQLILMPCSSSTSQGTKLQWAFMPLWSFIAPTQESLQTSNNQLSAFKVFFLFGSNLPRSNNL